MISGFYVYGDTPIHRARPGLKLLGLVVFSTAIFLADTWPVLLAATALLVTGYIAAGLNLAHAWRALRPVLVILGILFLVQLYLVDLSLAAYVVLRFAVLILAATLVTLTTRVSEMVGADFISRIG